MTKKSIATIAMVEHAIETFKIAAQKDPNLELASGKKLAVAVEYLTAKDGVTKDLSYAYTNAEKWWAVNVLKDKDGCTKDNKESKIKGKIEQSDAYTRHMSNPDTKEKAEAWLVDKFKVEVA